MKLLRNGQSISNIFQLIGNKENDMTAGLAYLLSNSPALLTKVVQAILRRPVKSVDSALVLIQTVRSQQLQGITDIEIRLGDEFFAVLEAKQGPTLPSDEQLTCYAKILEKSHAKDRYLVTISNASNDIAALQYPKGKVGNAPLIHISWLSIKRMVEQSISQESNAVKKMLREYSEYLKGILGMNTKQSNMVYVVALAQGKFEEWNVNWIDVVEKHDKYFYPVGRGYPDPPNYIGFRYNGKLQSIRHVRSHRIFTNPREIFPEARNFKTEPHYCLELDPPIIPSHEIRTGPRIVRAGRVWCMIDALLTSKTISDALTETERRLAEING
jgi:hypothetical protein